MDSGDVLFSTHGNPLVFSNQFIQLNTTLPTNHNISGLGESYHRYINEPGSIRTIYSNDRGNIEDGNIYGSHPVYYDERSQSGSHAVYWRSSNIQEVIIEDTSLTWRSLGGIIDLYFYAGPTSKEAISQFVSSIGLPALQPYWSLGYHQCRWGYNSLEEVEDVIQNLKRSDIPLETMWLDIDFMDHYKDFTNDESRYPLKEFQKFIASLHENNQHFVPIVDAAIHVPFGDDNKYYEPYSSGIKQDVFLKNPDNSIYIGKVWPGYTVFPDFLANRTALWWTETLKNWYEDIKFDGIWLDMNEAASFCVGSCGSSAISDISINNNTKSLLQRDEQPNSDPDNSKMKGKGNINYPPNI
ncbi:unnamed protein product [Ambrosiozyma monospora]|uniref:Unnamed protein product n=1 Tax=Ambrosiozyma monospora TaxID=43982 RepID=A0ACB5U2C4_AMBMO|nr:unnamed protein product [Ambrosiozyma monospora]